MGYAVLLAVRRGHNGAPGIFWETRVTAPWGSPEMGPQLVDAVEDECDDAVAALAWVKEQPMVDAARVAMIGSSYGGVMVMLAARRRAAFRAGVSFAGPSITWPDAPALQDVLLDAMRTTEVPLFLVQAADDVHLTPTYAARRRAGLLRKGARGTHLRSDRREPRRRSRRLQQGRRPVATRHRALPVPLDQLNTDAGDLRLRPQAPVREHVAVT